MTGPASILPLEMRHVSFAASGETLLKEIDCSLEAGPRTIVIGPNGAGKSLFLRLCHGLIKPSAGDVIWHGAGKREPAHHQTMVLQRPVLLRRTVAANVDYALSVKGVPRRQRGAIVAEVLAGTGLSRLTLQQARRLSAGEQQKLALARAWAIKPQVLFLDEPTASLDPAATHAVEKIIDQIHTTGTKIIMTTHDLSQARRMADEVLFLHRGQLLEKSPADRFFSGPADEMAQAFIDGELLWWE